MKSRSRFKITMNSPVILGFSLICFISLIVNILTNGVSNRLFFSVYRSSLASPLTYWRFLGHVIGHANFEHFIGNFMMILVVGPLLEEKYGGKKLLCIMLVTAVITGITNFLFFPTIQLLGASGIVFAFILLASLTSLKDGEIPLTFIIVAILYLGQQIYQGIFIDDNVSNLTHVLGGTIGSGMGFLLNKNSNKGY
ncbi:MAG: rhomboid family intramembrane serine protease [Lachnospiraceae bacterium]|nr:rhomboid family intramembrane serine protease [Lachnospiraceae bacterium]